MRFGLVLPATVLLLLAVPVGTFDTTPRLTADGPGAVACKVVTSNQLAEATSAKRIAVEPSVFDSRDDHLGESFPFVRRTGCAYQFSPSCVRTALGVDIKGLQFQVITMADAVRARRRYEAGRAEKVNPTLLHRETFRDRAEVQGLGGFSVASARNRVLLVHHSGRYIGGAIIVLCRADTVDLVDTIQRLYDWWTGQLRSTAEFG